MRVRLGLNEARSFAEDAMVVLAAGRPPCPICGEPLYLPGRQLGAKQTVAINAPPLCLQSRSITFTHPLSRERRTFTAPLPSWADEGAAQPLRRSIGDL